MPDDLVAQHEARLEYLAHHILAEVLIVDVHDGVVLLRVEGRSLGLDLRDAQLLQDLLVLVDTARSRLSYTARNSLMVSALAS